MTPIAIVVALKSTCSLMAGSPIGMSPDSQNNGNALSRDYVFDLDY